MDPILNGDEPVPRIRLRKLGARGGRSARGERWRLARSSVVERSRERDTV